MSELAGLRWTGHPLVDIGMAGVCAASKKQDPTLVTLDELDAISDEMREAYYDGAMMSYLSNVFTRNVTFLNNPRPETLETFDKAYVRGHRAQIGQPRVEGMICVFSGRTATAGLNRQHLPLFSGEGFLNFRPGGQTFVPVSGAYIVCLLYSALVAPRVEARMLAVHVDDPILQIALTKYHRERNRSLFKLFRMNFPQDRGKKLVLVDAAISRLEKGKHKFPDSKGARSLLLADLTEAFDSVTANDLNPRDTSATAYLLMNGQEPEIESFHLPSSLMRFVYAASRSVDTASSWKHLLSRYQDLIESDDATSSNKKRRPARRVGRRLKGGPGLTKNPVCEDLIRIFEAGFADKKAAARWIRRYVLGRPDYNRTKDDTQAFDATGARSWPLTELVLKELLDMHESRIKGIKDFAVRLAAYMADNESRYAKRLRDAFFVSGRYGVVRSALIDAQRDAASRATVLFGLEDYARVWHADRDQYLVLDLVTIALIEELGRRGYFEKHPEAIAERDPEASTGEDGDQEEEVLQ